MRTAKIIFWVLVILIGIESLNFIIRYFVFSPESAIQWFLSEWKIGYGMALCLGIPTIIICFVSWLLDYRKKCHFQKMMNKNKS